MLNDIGRYPRLWQSVALVIIASVGVLSTIASSSGGSGGTPPVVTITFPPEGFETDARELTVTGTASDETSVASVTVNGISASTNNGFATWEAVVPVVEGPNTLTAAASDSLGFTNPMAASVNISVAAAPPLATITFPPANSFSDANSVTVTGTASDNRSAVAEVQVNGVDATTTDGFATWRAVVPLNQGTNTLTVLTVDMGGFSDPAAAEVVVNVANDVSGNAVTFGDGYAVAVDGDEAFVVDFDSDQLMRVDINTGTTQIVSDAATGSGPLLSGPAGIELINGGADALVTNFVTDELLSVGLVDGARTTVSSAGQNVGVGPTLFGPSGIAVIDRTLAVVSNLAADDIMSVDLTNSNRSVLTGDGTRGAGPAFLQPDGIALDVNNDRIIVTDGLLPALLEVSLTTGDRAILSDNAGAGNGPNFVNPTGVVLDESGTAALVVDRDTDLVLIVNLVSGDRAIFSDANSGTGDGPAFSIPTGIALDSVNMRAVVSGQNLVVIELGSGDRVIVGQ